MEQKRCEQCHKEKDLTEFRKSNSKIDGHMRMCKECYNENMAETQRRAQEEWEQRAGLRAELRERQQQNQERDRLLALVRTCSNCGASYTLDEEHWSQYCAPCQQRADEWFAQQPERECRDCKRTFPLGAFKASPYYREGILVAYPYQRCEECHEIWRKNFCPTAYPTCQMCGTVKKYSHFLQEYNGNRLDIIKVCCTDCIPQFTALPENEQIAFLRRAMVKTYGAEASIYCIHYGDGEHHNHIGRTKNIGRRMSQYRAKLGDKFHHYHILEKLPFGPLSMERESLWMAHAIKHGWPIDNFLLMIVDKDRLGFSQHQQKIAGMVQTIEPLTAPWSDTKPIVQSFMGTLDAEIVRWFLEREPTIGNRPH